MPALSSAASTLPFQPGILIPPSVTAREPSTVGLPGPPTNCFLARNSATSKATKTIAEPIRILDFLFIVGPQSEFGPTWLLTLLECHIWSRLNVCIHAQPIRQLSTWIELYQCLEDLGVYPLCRLVGANILVSQFVADAYYTPCEFPSAKSVRRDICGLSDSHLWYFCFVHIHANSK